MNVNATHSEFSRRSAARGDLGACAARLRRRGHRRLLRPLDARRRHPRRRGRVSGGRDPARLGPARVVRVERRPVRQPRGRHDLLAGAGPQRRAGPLGLGAVLARDLPLPVHRPDRVDPQPYRPDALGHAPRRTRRRPRDRLGARVRDGVRRRRGLGRGALLGAGDQPRLPGRRSHPARRDRQRRRPRGLANRSPVGDAGRRDHRARGGRSDLHDGARRRPRRRRRGRVHGHRHRRPRMGRGARSQAACGPACPDRSGPVRPGRVRGARAGRARARRAAARQRRRARPRRRGARARARADGAHPGREPHAARRQPRRGRHRPADRPEQPAPVLGDRP